jgi:purine-binding chemotaxis protein CheW
MPSESSASHDVLIFRAGEHHCAIASHHIAELILMPALIRLPGQPALLDGFLNLRGRTVPVARLHHLLQIVVPEPSLHSPLIVVQTGQDLLALRVDSIDQVVSVDDEALIPCTGANSLNDCAIAQFYSDGEDIALLSAERLLLAKERECVADLAAQVQGRVDLLKAPPA